MNLIQRKIYLYNVTFGLYMLDWWERCLFNVLVIVLLWFVCYNGSRSAAEFYTRMRICMKGFLRLAFEVPGSVSRLLPQRQRCIEILKPVAREANASKL